MLCVSCQRISCTAFCLSTYERVYYFPSFSRKHYQFLQCKNITSFQVKNLFILHFRAYNIYSTYLWLNRCSFNTIYFRINFFKIKYLLARIQSIVSISEFDSVYTRWNNTFWKSQTILRHVDTYCTRFN